METDGCCDNMKYLEDQIQTAISYVTSLEIDEDAYILCGLSKAGKSSLANCLTGVKLKGMRKTRTGPIILKNDNVDDGAEIGHGAASQTTIPRKYEPDKLVIWDTPGIDDNRNELRDIINAIYISELFKKVKSAKIILVVDIESIKADNVKLMLTLLTAIENLFNVHLRRSFAALSIVFTKVEEYVHSNLVDRELIAEILTDKFLSEDSPKISEVGKDLLSHFIENHEKIGIFKRPTESDTVVNDAITDGILEAIKNAARIQQDIFKKITPSLSEKSKVFLHEVRNKLCSSKMLVRFQDLVRKVLGNKLISYGKLKNNRMSSEELDVASHELYAVKDKLEKSCDDGISLYRKLDTLKTLDSRIMEFIDKLDLYRKIQFLEITDKLLGQVDSHYFDTSITQIFVFGILEINSVFCMIQEKRGTLLNKKIQDSLEDNTKKYAMKMQLLENILSELRAENENLVNKQEGRCAIL